MGRNLIRSLGWEIFEVWIWMGRWERSLEKVGVLNLGFKVLEG